jgi:homogentisate 1,2-dioxygenase
MIDPTYISGFADVHAAQAVAGALPVGRNSPQRPPLGRSVELLSDTIFRVRRRATKLAAPDSSFGRSSRLPTDRWRIIVWRAG